MTPLLLAVDPGSRESAAVLVAPAPRGRIHVVRSGMVAEGEWLDWLTKELDVVAIERAEGPAFAPFRVPHLLEAQWTAGYLAGLAVSMLLHVKPVSAQTWRAGVIGHLPRAKPIPGVKKGRGQMDATIARALPLFVEGLEASNPHVRDALGLAVFVARQIWKRAA